MLEAARRKDPGCSVILMTARGTMETVMAATRGGAFDYIAKPFDLDRIIETVKRAEAAYGELRSRAEGSARERNDRLLARQGGNLTKWCRKSPPTPPC